MRLSELMGALDAARIGGAGDPVVGRVVCDSRQVRPGDVFVAIPGTKIDGHRFAADAARAGAAAVVGQRAIPELPAELPRFTVADPRRALPRLCHARHGFPAAGMKIVGITGTKGKTTTSFIVRSVLQTAGMRPGLLGTVVYDLLSRCEPAPLTTPDAAGIAECFAELRAAGGDSAVMEVSSIALDQGRTDGLDFAAAVFTNLSGDHLDYHGTMENYLLAKARLFEGLAPGRTAVLNADNEWSVPVARRTPAQLCWFSLCGKADVWADRISVTGSGTRFLLHVEGASAVIQTRLVGRHNVANCLAAAGAALAIGIGFDTVAEGLRRAPAVPGRLEPVDAGQDFTVLVDYAHTDDSLAKVLAALRPLTAGRLMVVFGCGGDRDRTKRPRMAAAAEAGADRVFVTSDNPRTERAEDIIGEILSGFTPAGLRKVAIDADRRSAIGAALAEARPGDVVLIAGKGHEDYQILGTTKIHFDDREVARECLGAARRGAAGM